MKKMRPARACASRKKVCAVRLCRPLELEVAAEAVVPLSHFTIILVQAERFLDLSNISMPLLARRTMFGDPFLKRPSSGPRLRHLDENCSGTCGCAD